MLQIILKRNLSPVNKLTKDFDNAEAEFMVALKEETDIFKPTFILQTIDPIWHFNYIDGSAFSGRQYFITDIRSVGLDRYEIDAKTDVLSTWAEQIKENYAVISRQEKLYNLYLDDPYFHVYNYERIQTLKFPDNTFMKSLQYVLVTNGYSRANEQEESNQSEFSQLKNEGGENNGY